MDVVMLIVVLVEMAVANFIVVAHRHGRRAARVHASLGIERHQLGQGIVGIDDGPTFKLKLKLGRLLWRLLWRRLWRRRDAEADLGRQRRRGVGHDFSHHRRRRRELGSATAQDQGALHQSAGVMRGRCAAFDGIDPGFKLTQRVCGEAVQRGVDTRVFGQARVVDLLAGPGGVAEVAQTDHARAALERVEGTAHQRDVAQPFGVGGQVLQRLACITNDLARFFDEDAAHLGVVFQARLARRHRLGIGTHFGNGRGGRHLGYRHRDRELADGLRQVSAHRRFGLVVHRVGQRLLGL